MPGVFAARHDGGGADDRGHVQVVTAGVHDGNVAPGVVFGMNFAGVGKAGFFFDGKGIEFGAQHDRRARPIFQDGDNAGASDVLGDVIAERRAGARRAWLRFAFRARRVRDTDEDRDRDVCAAG